MLDKVCDFAHDGFQFVCAATEQLAKLCNASVLTVFSFQNSSC